MKKFKHIYGPVSSWRLGRSLGVDPLSQKDKICTFDCTYCQIGETLLFSSGRKMFVSTEAILKEIVSLPRNTLAKNLGDIIKRIKKIRKEKIAVITNASLIERPDVQADLLAADFIMLKFDANAEDLFMGVNRPSPGIKFGDIVKGIKRFTAIYKGRAALQVMLVKKNKAYAKEIAKMAVKLGIKEIQLNTPLRVCAEQALSKPDMDAIKKYFKGMKIDCVYGAKIKHAKPMDKEDAERRHGRGKR